MKKTLILFVLAAVSVALAKPVKSILSADNTEFIEGTSFAPTAADYVQDGLVAMWDAIENVDWGVHDNDSTVWVELVSGTPCALSGTLGTHFWWEDNGCVKNHESRGTFVFDLTDSQEQAARAASFSVEVVNSEPTESNSWQAQTINICSAVQLSSYSQGITARYRRMDTGTTSGPSGTDSWTYPRGNGYQIESRSVLNTDSLVYDGDSVWTYSSGSIYGSARAVTPNPEIEGVYVRLGSSAYSFCGRYHCVRIYNRPLTSDEVYHNALIDRLRFNLP